MDCKNWRGLVDLTLIRKTKGFKLDFVVKKNKLKKWPPTDV